MRLSRLILWGPVALFAVLLVYTLGTTGCGEKPKGAKTPGKRTLSCETTIHVTPAAVHGVDKDSIYVCDDPGFNKVSWIAPPGVTFEVHFASTTPADCPFNPCPASITDGRLQTVAPQPNGLTVYKYWITVNGTTHDPHVIGGG